MHQKTLDRSLKEWTDKGLISNEQAELISNSNQPLNSKLQKEEFPLNRKAFLTEKKKPSGTKYLMFVFAILGSLLIGTGMVMIIASNWWRFPQLLKASFALIPLGVGQIAVYYYWTQKPNSYAWREASTLFLSLAIFASVSLVTQTFHIIGDFSDFIAFCSIALIPLIYLTKSTSTTLMYLFCIVGVVADRWDRSGTLLYSLTILPYLGYKSLTSAEGVKRGCAIAAFMSLGATLLVHCLYFLEWREPISVLLLIVFWLIAVECVIERTALGGKSSLARTISFVSGIFLVMGLAIFIEAYVGIIYILPLLSFPALYLWYRRTVEYDEYRDLLVIALTLTMLTSQFIGIGANVTVALIGIYLTARGASKLQYVTVNFGLAITILIVVIRFFDSSLSILFRGIAFILIGLAFLGANAYLVYKKGETKDEG